MFLNASDDAFATAGKHCLFLVGVPRSGTTWLQRLLTAHPDVGSSQESHLFNHYLSPMLRQWERNLNFDDGRGGIGLPAYFTEQAFLKSVNTFAFEALSQSQDFNKNRFFIEKTPDHLSNLADIQAVIPSARFIYLEREPAEVVESLMAAGRSWGHAWAPRSVIGASRLYFSYRNKAQLQLTQLDPASVYTLSYGDLKADMPGTLNRLSAFLKLDFPENLLERMTTQDQPLRRYGEFARRNGQLVEEPSDFARGKNSGSVLCSEP